MVWISMILQSELNFGMPFRGDTIFQMPEGHLTVRGPQEASVVSATDSSSFYVTFIMFLLLFLLLLLRMSTQDAGSYQSEKDN